MKKHLLSLFETLTSGKARVISVSTLLFAVIAGFDHFANYQVSFASFYLLPIILLTWRLGLGAGLTASVICAFMWLLDDYWTIEHSYVHPAIPYWNAVVHFIFFATTTVLLDRVNSLLRRARAESELKSAMIHAVSHEFNNALTGMTTGLYLLAETDKAAADGWRANIYSAISSSQGRLQLYVKNILNEARMEDGKFRLEKKPLLLRELLEEAAMAVSELLKQKNIKLEKNLPELPAMVLADKDALALVISNLLGNAVKYTPQDGRITAQVSSFPESGRVIFSVEDNGAGISLEDVKKITAGFYRTDEGKAAADGFGLGLKISNDLLALHGSRLQIASEKGKGSSFFFELPFCGVK